MKKNNLIIYQAKNGAIQLKGDYKKETLWASQFQIVELFNVDQSVISRHIRNIFKDGEVNKKSNMQKMHVANFRVKPTCSILEQFQNKITVFISFMIRLAFKNDTIFEFYMVNFYLLLNFQQKFVKN